ncbi:hypothetical protein [Halobacteriovorax sp. HLS]|uniref:hypothetical protein n=1 Tax=Halobacteriovorax sp. HLS TaxID=2234000 RepID=UPI000FDC0B66|nr:hypothetical protein [Halobacteriovorax sp. HLS]
MRKLGLVGRNISHSKSQQMYEEILGEPVDYSLFDFEEESKIPKLEYFFNLVDGLSITAPYKKQFLKDVILDREIEALGAINCIKKEGNQYFGTNTDFMAVEQLLRSYTDKSIVILGDGSMASITIAALNSLKLQYRQYSRRSCGDITKLDLSNLNNGLIINTCSREFLYEGALSKDTIFWDYNYSSSKQAKIIQNKYSYVDGLELLKLQAKFALDFWD